MLLCVSVYVYTCIYQSTCIDAVAVYLCVQDFFVLFCLFFVFAGRLAPPVSLLINYSGPPS